MAESNKIEQRTEDFIKEYKRLKKAKLMVVHQRLKEILNVKSKSTISEILGKRQNIQPEQWEAFKKHFGVKETDKSSETKDKTPMISEHHDLNEENRAENSERVFLTMYKEANEKRIKELKEHNAFLQRMIETSLGKLDRIERLSESTLADLKGSMKYQAEREAKGDIAKQEDIESHVSKLAGDALVVILSSNTSEVPYK